MAKSPCVELVDGKIYWVKDVRGGSRARWEPSRYRAPYRTVDGSMIPARWQGCGGDSAVAEIGPEATPPKDCP